MIKLLIFDLDGVLLDAKNIHFETLNRALAEVDKKFVISHNEHISLYDGLKTHEKLNMLSRSKGLPLESHEVVWKNKQKYTIDRLQNLLPDEKLINILKILKSHNYKLACCSNSIRDTILTALNKKEICGFFDLIISNEEVKNSKPHPEMYWNAMSKLGCNPEETLIVEDSPVGLLAAKRSNANILRVKNPADLTLLKIKDYLTTKNNMNDQKPKWTDKKLNVVIPMAGAGSRFEKAGYTFPKPLIDVRGKPMIQVVVENLGMDAQYTFIVQKSHRIKYNLDVVLNMIAPDCNIVEVEGVTEGAACTVLLAKEFINNDNPLIMANSDQYVEWNSVDFMYKMQEQDVDAGILTFESLHPKWSYAKVDEMGYVTEVAEKNPISNIATVGIYYWKKGEDFVNCAETMIEKNIRVNNEFYVCPVFNEAVLAGKKIKTFNAEKMWGIGTPEDLNVFLNNFTDV